MCRRCRVSAPAPPSCANAGQDNHQFGLGWCRSTQVRCVVTATLSPLARRTALGVGAVLTLGGVLWCLGGAGIYGSPLAGMQGEELTRIWVFLLAGPFSALPAALLARWYPMV